MCSLQQTDCVSTSAGESSADASPDGRGLRWIVFLASLAAIFFIHLAFVMPAFENWGATVSEQQESLPGDNLVRAESQQTNAITIDAPIDQVWPWLAQLGQDRGGFYSYEVLENLVGCQMPTRDYLRPDKQLWKAGDRLWMYPRSKGIELTGA